MMSDYIDRFYNKLKDRHAEMIKGDYALAREMALWKKRVRNEWPFIEVVSYNKPDSYASDINFGEEYTAEVSLSIGDLSYEDIGVEMLVAENGTEGTPHIRKVIEFDFVTYDSGIAKYRCTILADSAGVFSLAGRVYAKNSGLPHRQDFDLVKWL